MPRQPENWPAGVLPRMLDVRLAAHYVGLSATTFLSRVRAGRYPNPEADGKRLLWDRFALDAFLDVRSGMQKLRHGEEVDQDEKARALRAIG